MPCLYAVDLKEKGVGLHINLSSSS